MDRRKSLKVLGLTAISTGLLLEACKEKEKEVPLKENAKLPPIDRTPEEAVKDQQVLEGKIYTEHERKTIAILSDIIIPADDISGSATGAGVPQFIEAISIDKPEHQVPMKGGLRWLDLQCIKSFEKPFAECSRGQQITMVDQIAYPKKATAEMKQGVAFFNLMRNLVISGFYTSEMGLKDLGYVGNKPNQWNGVPDDVLKQYGLAYTEKDLRECISFP